MKAFLFFLAIIVSLVLTSPAFAAWDLKLGPASNELGFVNPPSGPEDFPLGPHSFRLAHGELWVADSVKGRILKIGKKAEVLTEIKVPGLKEPFFLDDFAIQFNGEEVIALWVAERFSTELIKVSPDGKELVRVKNSGLAQLDELGVDSKGQLYVGDFGKSLLATFSPDGKKLREIPWQMSGFAVDNKDNLHMIRYDEETAHQHLVIDANGKETGRTRIGFAEMQNPRLWQVNDEGDIFVSFVPQSGNPTKNVLVTISQKGLILKKIAYTNPYYIGRYLMVENNDCLLVKADYLKAPKLSITVAPAGKVK